jgi:hypothetical protein
MRCLLTAVMATSMSSAMALDCTPATVQKEVTERAARDQVVRKRLVASLDSKELHAQALLIDAENTAYMRVLIAECGWPKKSVVGEEGAKAAWLLTQHADMDPQYQVLASQQMRYAVLAKEASAERLASLVDRNRMLTHQPLVYGVSFYTGPDKIIRFYDIVTPGQLDARRSEIGLIPFYCYALQLSRNNGDAPIEWPDGVLLAPTNCATVP